MNKDKKIELSFQEYGKILESCYTNDTNIKMLASDILRSAFIRSTNANGQVPTAVGVDEIKRAQAKKSEEKTK